MLRNRESCGVDSMCTCTAIVEKRFYVYGWLVVCVYREKNSRKTGLGKGQGEGGGAAACSSQRLSTVNEIPDAVMQRKHATPNLERGLGLCV